jgi:hypothetical protein
MTEMYALAAAMGIRLREVPIPAEALAFMQDVLDNTSEADHGLAAHDTSLGTHNLSMSGDMPIAHLPMIELLLVLDEMLRIGEHERANCLGTTEATEWAIAAQARAVAECAGATLDRRPYNSALLIVVAVQAACRCLRRPHMFPSIGFAAGYTERVCETRCTESMCRTWMLEIEQQTRAEASNAATAQARIDALLQQAARSQREQRAARRASEHESRTRRCSRGSATGLAPNSRTHARSCPHAKRSTARNGSLTRTARCAPASPRSTRSHANALDSASTATRQKAASSTTLLGRRLPRFQKGQ